MRRFGTVLAAVAFAAAVTAVSASTAKPPTAISSNDPVKIDVMGEWAHPDDDTSIIGPCGVWHQRYGVRCGIIMVTRGEGGGNAVGTELGPALGLRRENEDRVAHYRSGTVDIFNLDRVDFFYNQSAPLTQYFWGDDETLRRVTRVIRTTQPDVYIGFTPTLAAGHGNHQQAGRLIWEGMLAAANPTMFPEQLTGPDALSTWQVKKIFSGGSTAGTGGTTTAANCTTGFLPTPGRTWTRSPACGRATTRRTTWPAGNVQGKTGQEDLGSRSPSEGASAYPTQSRVMNMGTSTPGCSRFGQTWAAVPFQPNTNPDGTANPLAGKDDAILYGATVQDPGGLPLGTLEYLTFSRFLNVAGKPFQATLHLKAGSASDPGRHRRADGAGGLDGRRGAADRPRRERAPRRRRRSQSRRARRRPCTELQDLRARHERRGDRLHRQRRPRSSRPSRVASSAGATGPSTTTGSTTVAPQAIRLGRSAAIQSTGVGETFTLPVVVHNWSTTPQSGTVVADAAGQRHRRRDVQAVRPARARRRHDRQLHDLEHVHERHAPRQRAAPNSQNTNVNVRITTTLQHAGGERVRGPDARHRPDDGDPGRSGGAGGRRGRGRGRVRGRRGARRRPEVGARRVDA